MWKVLSHSSQPEMIEAALLLVISLIVLTAADIPISAQFAIDPTRLFINSSVNGRVPSECTLLFEKQYVFPFGQILLPELVEKIDDICREFEVVAPCLWAVRRYVVQAFRQELDVALEKFLFLCSASGKTGLKDYQDSPCSSDDNTIKQIEELRELCINSTATMKSEDERSRCLIAKKIDECGYKISTEICGYSVAAFLRGLLIAHYRAIPKLRNCFANHVVEVNSNVLIYSSSKQ